MLNQALKLSAWLLTDRKSEAVNYVTAAIKFAEASWPPGSGSSKLEYVQAVALRALGDKENSVIDAVIHILLMLVRRTGGGK